MRLQSVITAVFVAVLMTPASAFAQSQTDFYCEGFFWTKNAFTGSFQREENQRSDNFRLRILPGGVIRITGSDIYTNGEHRSRRTGDDYVFEGAANVRNGLGQPLGRVGQTSFNARTGRLEQAFNTPHPLLNMRIEQIAQADCE